MARSRRYLQGLRATRARFGAGSKQVQQYRQAHPPRAPAARGTPGTPASATPQPYLTPEQQGAYNDRWYGLQTEGIGATQDYRDAIASDPLVRAQIEDNYHRNLKGRGEELAGRGLNARGTSDAQLWDVNRAHILANLQQDTALQRARDRHDAIIEHVQTGQFNLQQEAVGTKLGNLYADDAYAVPGSRAAGFNAAQAGSGAQPRTPAAPMNVPGAVGLQGQRRGDRQLRTPLRPGRSAIVPKGNRVFTPGGRPVGMYRGSPRGYAISLTPGGRTRVTRQRRIR